MIWVPDCLELPVPSPSPVRHSSCGAWLPIPCPLGSSWPSLCPGLFFIPNVPFVSRSRKLSQKGLGYWQVEIKPHCCSSRLVGQILVGESLIAFWLVVGFSASPRRHVISWCSLKHELSAKGFLKCKSSGQKSLTIISMHHCFQSHLQMCWSILAITILKSSGHTHACMCNPFREGGHYRTPLWSGWQPIV